MGRHLVHRLDRALTWAKSDASAWGDAGYSSDAGARRTLDSGARTIAASRRIRKALAMDIAISAERLGSLMNGASAGRRLARRIRALRGRGGHVQRPGAGSLVGHLGRGRVCHRGRLRCRDRGSPPQPRRSRRSGRGAGHRRRHRRRRRRGTGGAARLAGHAGADNAGRPGGGQIGDAAAAPRNPLPAVRAARPGGWLAYNPYLPAMAVFGLPKALVLPGLLADPRPVAGRGYVPDPARHLQDQQDQPDRD